MGEVLNQIKIIRRALKSLCPTLSVRNGLGTSYGWVDIRGSDRYGGFTKREVRALRKFGLSPSGNYCSINPEDRRHKALKKAKQILRRKK